MRLQGPAKRLTILVGETDQWHHRPLYTEIVHRAHAAERIAAFLRVEQVSEHVRRRACGCAC